MNVQAMFSFSELAFAAYATLIRGSTTAQQAALEAADVGMSPKQAEEFARLYPTVVTSFDDAPNTSFQVTVFKDTAGDLPGNLTIAFRGTTIPEDLSTGLDIVGFGTGYDQIVAMANWWLRASAKDQMVQQFRLTSYTADAVPVDAVVIRPNGDSV